MPTSRSSIMSSFLSLLVLFATTAVAQDEKKHTNFIMLFVDDLGFDTKAYGHPYAKTPNLDRLAAEGTIFTDFHQVGNICPNSRAGFLTSRYPSWFANYTPDYGFRGTRTVMNLLKDAGYVTGHIGKWNIGPTPSKDAREYEPYGITDLVITEDGSLDPLGKERERYELAMEFVEKHQNEPFYLNLWSYAPHSPIDPPEYLKEEFDGLEVDESLFGPWMGETFDLVRKYGGNVDRSMRAYLGEVYGLDMEIGKLLNKLDVLGLTENTVVIFSSDNGPSQIDGPEEVNQVAWAGGLRGGKHSWYEGGMTVPMVLRWPGGGVPAGKVNRESHWSSLDWLPTVATIAGVEVPWDFVQGEDVSDIWKGSDRSRVNPTFYQDPGATKTAVRYSQWKFHDSTSELFDLSVDKQEMNNIWERDPEIVAVMADLRDQWKATLPVQYAFGNDATVPFDPNAPAIKIGPPEELAVTAATSDAPTAAPTTEAPTTPEPTGSTPTTAQPTSSEPTKEPSDEPTAAPTTEAPTTPEPTGSTPTTAQATSSEPTTEAPTSGPIGESPTSEGTPTSSENGDTSGCTSLGLLVPAVLCLLSIFA